MSIAGRVTTVSYVVSRLVLIFVIDIVMHLNLLRVVVNGVFHIDDLRLLMLVLGFMVAITVVGLVVATVVLRLVVSIAMVR